MSQAVNQPAAAPETKSRSQSIFIRALKFGAIIALINTFIDGLSIWREMPSQAYITSLGGGGAGPDVIMRYRFSLLFNAAIGNLIMWFLAALIMLFVLKQFKKT